MPVTSIALYSDIRAAAIEANRRLESQLIACDWCSTVPTVLYRPCEGGHHFACSGCSGVKDLMVGECSARDGTAYHRCRGGGGVCRSRGVWPTPRADKRINDMNLAAALVVKEQHELRVAEQREIIQEEQRVANAAILEAEEAAAAAAAAAAALAALDDDDDDGFNLLDSHEVGIGAEDEVLEAEDEVLESEDEAEPAPAPEAEPAPEPEAEAEAAPEAEAEPEPEPEPEAEAVNPALAAARRRRAAAARASNRDAAAAPYLKLKDCRTPDEKAAWVVQNEAKKEAVAARKAAAAVRAAAAAAREHAIADHPVKAKLADGFESLAREKGATEIEIDAVRFEARGGGD